MSYFGVRVLTLLELLVLSPGFLLKGRLPWKVRRIHPWASFARAPRVFYSNLADHPEIPVAAGLDAFHVLVLLISFGGYHAVIRNFLWLAKD